MAPPPPCLQNQLYVHHIHHIPTSSSSSSSTCCSSSSSRIYVCFNSSPLFLHSIHLSLTLVSLLFPSHLRERPYNIFPYNLICTVSPSPSFFFLFHLYCSIVFCLTILFISSFPLFLIPAIFYFILIYFLLNYLSNLYFLFSPICRAFYPDVVWRNREYFYTYWTRFSDCFARLPSSTISIHTAAIY